MISSNLDLGLSYPGLKYYCTLLLFLSRYSTVDRRLRMTCSNLDLGLSLKERRSQYVQEELPEGRGLVVVTTLMVIR